MKLGITFILAVALPLFSISSRSEGAVFSVKSSVSLAEEYDDNIFLTPENKVHDYITRVTPSLMMKYMAAFWDWNLDYKLLWRYYADQRKGRDSHYANVESHMKVIDKLLYFDVFDSYESVLIDPRGAYSESNLDVNRTDANTLTASPYIKYSVTPRLTFSTGYRYINLWFRETNGIGRQLHTAFAAAEHQFTPTVTGSLGFEYTADRPEKIKPDNDQITSYVKAAYKMNPRTTLDGKVGFRHIDFSGNGKKDRVIYDAGLVYNFSEKGKLEIRANSTLRTSPELGIYESQVEQAVVRYGTSLVIEGKIFHRIDSYFETNRRDDVFGATAGGEYNPSKRMVFRLSGTYEKDRYRPADQDRNIFYGDAGIDYRLAPKATLGLYTQYTRSTGDIVTDDYVDHIFGLQLKIEI